MKANVNDSSEKIKITPEMLKNGDVLAALILRFLNNRSKENMMSVFMCLREGNVFIPADVQMNGNDLKIGGAGDNPIMFPASHQIQIKPQFYKATDGKIYMPLYSRRENAKPSELKGVPLVNLPYLKCVEMLEENDMCSRFVIDPKLYNVVLDEDLIEISKSFPSRLEKNHN